MRSGDVRQGGHRRGVDLAIQEALEPAPQVWPPARRDTERAGREAASAYLRERLVFESPDQLRALTKHPQQYSEEVVRPRMVEAISRLPRDAFDILASGKREVVFHIQPAPPNSPAPIAETRPLGPGSGRTYVVFLRAAMELDDPTFTGVVVHELCHVLLDHPAPIAWPQDPYEQRKFTAGIETAALRLGDALGFKEETWALRDLLFDLAEGRGEREYIRPDGEVRRLELERKRPE